MEKFYDIPLTLLTVLGSIDFMPEPKYKEDSVVRVTVSPGKKVPSLLVLLDEALYNAHNHLKLKSPNNKRNLDVDVFQRGESYIKCMCTFEGKMGLYTINIKFHVAMEPNFFKLEIIELNNVDDE